MESKSFRSRCSFLALSVLLVVAFVTSANAQGLFGIGLSGLPSFGGTFEGTSCGSEPCVPVVSAEAQVGYGHMGLNFNLPAPLANIDLAFRDANVWIGSVGARVDSCSGFWFALRGQANASKRIGIETEQAPFSASRWDGTKFQWWELEGSIGYRVRPWWSVLVGLRRDQLTVGLSNPTANGTPLNFTLNVPLVSISGQFHGDFSSKLWIPYFGLEIAGQCYRASLLYSPFASADIRVPDVFFQTIFVAVGSSVLVQTGIDFEYKVSKPTQFFEYNFEYNAAFGPNIAFQVWSTGTWMQLRGRGNLDELTNSLVVIGTTPPLIVPFTTALSSGNTATYTRSMISGGIGVAVNF